MHVPPQHHARQIFVKVCGLTDPDQARAVARLGADWIGLNFHPPSPRFLSDERAREVIAAVREETVEAVGLYVDRPAAEVLDHARALGLSIVQLHGGEPPATVARLRRAGMTVVRAYRLSNLDAVHRMLVSAFLDDDPDATPDAVLADAFVPGLAGGTGQALPVEVLDALHSWYDPWSLAEREALNVSRDVRLILAGGLNAENVDAAVRRVNPWMVDVASGVESAPGRKDMDNVRAFITAARGRPG